MVLERAGEPLRLGELPGTGPRPRAAPDLRLGLRGLSHRPAHPRRRAPAPEAAARPRPPDRRHDRRSGRGGPSDSVWGRGSASPGSAGPTAPVATATKVARTSVEGSTEQRSLARTFNEMTQRVKKLLRVQQDFVADASHQLRTPLTGLRLRLEGLGERFRGEKEIETEVGAAMLEIDRLSQIVDELLILSRAGEHELPGEEVDLADASRRAAERWRANAAGRGIEIALGDGEAGASGWSVGPDLDRSIDALLENAPALLAAWLDRDDRLRARPGRNPRPGSGFGRRRGGGGLRAPQARRGW